MVSPAVPASTINLADGYNGSCGFVESLIYHDAEYINFSDSSLPFLSFSAVDQQLVVLLEEDPSVVGIYDFQFRMVSEAHG